MKGMMKQKIALLTAAVSCGVLLTACHPSEGDEFIGAWRQVKPYNPDLIQSGSDLIIERNGDSGFIVTLCRRLDANNGCSVGQPHRYPAALVSGALRINTPVGALDIGYDPQKKHVLFLGEEDQRASTK